ncbi:MAG: hypothetical protein QE271_13795 [Bacteriovoracaceae bacterium]|nr:hypothetical protein [Bacteriovoracaceae bacterium]
MSNEPEIGKSIYLRRRKNRSLPCGLVFTKPQSVTILLLAYIGFADSGHFINAILVFFTELRLLKWK